MEYPPLPGTPLEKHEDGSIEWLAQRREGIGSSDASIILGYSGYGSPYSLWMDKTGRLPFIPVSPELERLRRFGHYMEPLNRAMTSEELGIGIMKPESAICNPQISWLRANLDGWTTDGRIAEFKNVHQSQAREWELNAPDHPLLQVHHSGLVLGVSEAVIAAIIGGNRLVIHEVNLDNAVTDIVYEAEAEFWEHVEKDTPPPIDAHEKTKQALMTEWASHPEPKQVDEMDVSELVKEFHEAQRLEKEAKERKDKARNLLAGMAKGHNSLMTGEHVWAVVQGGQLDKKRLEAQHPEMMEKYTIQKPAFDLARFKKEQEELYREYQHKIIKPQ